MIDTLGCMCAASWRLLGHRFKWSEVIFKTTLVDELGVDAIKIGIVNTRLAILNGQRRTRPISGGHAHRKPRWAD